MCYNISNSTKEEKVLEKRLAATYPKKLGQIRIQFSVSGFTHPNLLVLTSEKPDEFQLFSWGLIPQWTPNADLAKQFSNNNLNAKAETIFEKRSFSEPVKQQRCLVPVTGFFEWRDVGKKKYPYFIHLKKEELFCLAGIYDEWVNKETGEIINSFSIITTAANPLMAKIHNSKLRMPFILPPDKEKEWLSQSLSPTDIQKLMQPLNEELMSAYTISKRITSRTDNPNVPETLEPFEYPELQLMDL